jgi:hypothetical protein
MLQIVYLQQCPGNAINFHNLITNELKVNLQVKEQNMTLNSHFLEKQEKTTSEVKHSEGFLQGCNISDL